MAKDALGNDVTVDGWLSTHLPGDRSLVQGLKGDATYLIVKEDKTIEEYGLNAVCTHLGCVVPWNKAENKFMCPCHGSQYDKTGACVCFGCWCGVGCFFGGGGVGWVVGIACA